MRDALGREVDGPRMKENDPSPCARPVLTIEGSNTFRRQARLRGPPNLITNTVFIRVPRRILSIARGGGSGRTPAPPRTLRFALRRARGRGPSPRGPRRGRRR